MDQLITKEMIQEGYAKGWIKLVTSETEYAPNNIDVLNLHLDTGEIMCGIGEYSFYFAGHEGESCSAKEYIKNVGDEEILKEIYDTLDGFRKTPDVYENEYLYYYWYLKEHLKG